jgi:hypothetical protein
LVSGFCYVPEEYGYSFTVEELEEQLQAAEGELSDEQLEAVTGGRLPIMRIMHPWLKKP